MLAIPMDSNYCPSLSTALLLWQFGHATTAALKLCLHSSVHLRHFSQYVMRFLSFRKNAHSSFAFSLILPIFITPFCRPHTSFILSLLGVISRGFLLCKQLLFRLRYIYRQAHTRLIFTYFFFCFRILLSAPTFDTWVSIVFDTYYYFISTNRYRF